MAHYIVSSGVTSEYLTLHSADSMTILDGGTTWDIILRNENSAENPSGCFVDISSGGVANLTSIGAGNMYVHSGGLSYYTYFISTGGSIYIFSGGTALGTLLKPKVSMFVSSGGTANNTLISAGANMFICAGGIVSGTSIHSGANLTISSSAIINGTVLCGGELIASSGATANNTIISSGIFHISSGGEANQTNLYAGGNLIVSSGGILSSATINGGLLAVCSRGVASNININEGGSMVIHSRGTATEVVENGGYVGITSGAKVSFLPNTFSGMELTNAVTIHSGTTANNITIKGIMEVYSGGETNNTSVRESGIMRVYAGGVANSNFVSQSLEIYSDGCANNVYVDGGSLTIYSSGVANNIELQFRSFLNISGGSASDTLVHSTCKMFISSGGVANNTQVDGFLYVQSGGIANDTMIGSADGTSTGSMHISNGAIANNITIMNGYVDIFSMGMAKGITLNNGLINVSSGGKIENVSINNHSIQIGSGGSGSDITINKNGNLIVGGQAIDIKENGGYVNVQHCTSASFLPNVFNDVTLSRGATVHSGTTANSTTISSGGSLFVFSDGVANNTTVVSGGVLFISSGAIVNNTIIKDKGEIGIMSSGVVKNTTVDYEGVLHVRSGTTATRTTINPEGTLFVSAYGTATEIIENGGYVYIEDEANAFFASNTFSDLVLSDYVSATVHSGTTATNVLIEEDGELHVFSGGKLTGQMIFEDGAIVSVYEGGTFEFNISTLRAGAETRINNLSIIQGTPIFSLTVSVEQSGGTYTLAEYAESFDKTISVVNASGDELGTLTVGDTLSVGDADYTLNLTGDVLSVAVVRPDLIPPTISNITASTTSPTNQPIILTADFTDDVGLASSLYRIGENSEWMDYIDGVTVTENMTVYFKAVDSSGNESAEVTYTVDNIDVIPPEKPVASADITDPTSGSVTVTATFSSDSVIREYSLDGQDWQPYVNGVTMIENGNVYFRSADAADNISEVTRYEITNIYTIHPLEKPILSADIITPTNQTVTISATFDVNAAKNEYSIDDLVWASYTSGVLMSENGTVYFRSSDQWGNSSEVASYTVGNIDKVKPTITGITPSTEEQAKSVTITAEFADDVGLASKLYRIGKNDEWQDYTDDGVVVSANVMVFFRAIDTAGNETEANYEVTNIDTTAPVITLAGDIEAPLQKTKLTATVDDGSDIYYSTDKENWTKYEGEIAVTGNGSYYFKATDAAGNTGTAEIVFENIQPAFALPDNLVGTPDKVSWEAATAGEEQQFVVEYSTDNFEHVIQVVTSASATDLLDLPAGTYQWRVRAENSEEWAVGETFVSEAESDTPKVVQSNEDGNDDLFFATTNGTWESIYYAQHVGSVGDWSGTNDWVSAVGKGRIQNLFFGSSDPNVLCLTDADNGDAIFVDDVYTDSPDDMAKETSRLYKIQEIRAGAGNDIVDMTSQRFEYTGDGLMIRGGDGDDTIWANKGNNWLFGDAGNDRIVGTSGNDVIVGGIGNDSMHGGGGSDIFTFCDNWGTDTVEQLATGTVTLWFASELEGKVAWDEESQSYTDGVNHVSVTGVASVTLKFGGTGDDAEQFAALSDTGAFDTFTSQRIFEESGKGIMA